MGLPFGTCLVFSQCMLHVLAACNVWDYLVVMISDLCSFCKALSWKSLWIKASAKCINVNVNAVCLALSETLILGSKLNVKCSKFSVVAS